MKVIIRNPHRKELSLEGERVVGTLLRELGLNPESVLVIRRGELLTRDEKVQADDTIEIVSAISGG